MSPQGLFQEARADPFADWVLLPLPALCLHTAASISTSVFAASEEAYKNPGDFSALPSLCWPNILHLAQGTLTHQMILEYKGDRCWSSLVTCNAPVCWAASGILDGNLKGTGPGRFSAGCWDLPAVCTWHAKQHRGGVTSPAPLKAKVEREVRNNYQL